MITDGRFSGGRTGLSLATFRLRLRRAAQSACWKEGANWIEVDIPARSLRVALSDEELATRRVRMDARGRDAWQPRRERVVSPALQAYAALTTSAARGAVRDVTQVARPR